jgi:hypothetical protein
MLKVIYLNSGFKILKVKDAISSAAIMNSVIYSVCVFSHHLAVRLFPLLWAFEPYEHLLRIGGWESERENGN